MRRRAVPAGTFRVGLCRRGGNDVMVHCGCLVHAGGGGLPPPGGAAALFGGRVEMNFKFKRPVSMTGCPGVMELVCMTAPFPLLQPGRPLCSTPVMVTYPTRMMIGTAAGGRLSEPGSDSPFVSHARLSRSRPSSSDPEGTCPRPMPVSHSQAFSRLKCYC